MISGIGLVVSAVDARPLEVTIVSVTKYGDPWNLDGKITQSFNVEVSFSRPWPGGAITAEINFWASAIYPDKGAMSATARPYRDAAESYDVSFYLFSDPIPGIPSYIVNPGPFHP